MSLPPRPLGIWNALENSAAETELLLARIDQGLCLASIFIAMWFATISPTIALPLIGLCCGGLLIATLTAALLKRRTAVGVARWILPLTEIMLPGAALLVITTVEGPAYALGSWVPPQLFFLFVSINVFRLRPLLPIVIGTIGAIEFWLIYWFAIRPDVAGDGVLLHLESVQLVRGGSLIVIGAAGTAAIYALRAMIARANAEVRSSDLFGKYKLLKPVGTGGMGIVHEALYCPEGGFERQVAVKLIHQHLADDQELVARFREEAAISALLTHPNLVGALDFGQVGDTYFFAMEFIDGPTFEQIRNFHKTNEVWLQPAFVANIGIEVCQGLQYAHVEARDNKGQPLRLLHRDLSPMNLMLDRSGRVKILDFGVARALRQARSLHTVHLVGKPSYFAPEQLQDHMVDERSDLWSVAVVLWELLCAETLFRRSAEHATMVAVCESVVPSPRLARDDLTRAWDRFFDRALDRTPERRFQSAFQMGEALREIARGLPPIDAADLAALARLEHLDDLELEL